VLNTVTDIKAYHVENSFSGLQRFSWLAAERPQSPHTYAGSLIRSFSSCDFESGGKSQTMFALFLDVSLECFRSDIGHLTWCYVKTYNEYKMTFHNCQSSLNTNIYGAKSVPDGNGVQAAEIQDTDAKQLSSGDG
jgi:hypothetical protein